jgi:hypothetical protein
VTSVAIGLAILAGLSGSVQVAVMGRFGDRIGVPEALTFATSVQLVLSLAIRSSRVSARAASAVRSARLPGCGSAA